MKKIISKFLMTFLIFTLILGMCLSNLYAYTFSDMQSGNFPNDFDPATMSPVGPDSYATLGIVKNATYQYGGQTVTGALNGVTMTLYKLVDDGFVVPDFDENEKVKYSDYNSYIQYVKTLAGATTEYGHDVSGTAEVFDERFKGTCCFLIPHQDFGRFLVVETDAPAAVVSNPVIFVVDVPTTNADGTGFNYDVWVSTKNSVEYNGITLKKVDQNGNGLPGATFALGKKNSSGTYVPCEYEGNIITGVTSSEVGKEGEISIGGLLEGEYVLVEVGAPDGYITDQALHEFTINADGKTSLHAQDDTMIVSNFNPGESLNKQIISANEQNSVSVGDTVKWEISMDIPTELMSRLRTYKIVDTLPESLEYVSATGVKVYGKDKTTLLNSSNYTVNYDSTTRELTIDLTNKNALADDTYSKLYVQYETIANSQMIVGKNGNENKVKLVYSRETLEPGQNPDDNPDLTSESSEKTTKVYTGGFHIKVVDNATSEKILTEAKFYIKDENGNYLKDESNNNIEITTSNGYADLTGIKYGTYYLEEIKSPTYVDAGGNVKPYNMQRQDKEIYVTGETYTTSANEADIDDIAQLIRLNKGFYIPLPVTGGNGTLIYIGAGVLILAIVLVLFISEKKKDKKNNENNNNNK